MKNLKVIFMGTPTFAVPTLELLIKNYNVVLVVSQPDKDKDKKGKIIPTKVKEVALKNNIDIYQPAKITNEYAKILEYKPDIIITCAYGQIIPNALLTYPKYGCINVHGSLLPKLRGGAPIHHALINGDKSTGITIMYMDEKMDRGSIISQKEIPILDNDNLDTLYTKLSILGSELLIETLPSIIDGSNKKIKQNENEATYGFNIKKEIELINFNKTNIEVFNQIRGLSSNPGAYTYMNNQILKIYTSSPLNKEYKGTVGEIVDITKEGFIVKTKENSILIKDIKLEGKKRCLVKDYLNGIRDKNSLIGVILGGKNE